MRPWKLATVSLVLASAGAPQDRPPDDALLARIRSHMRAELSHLPNYTCLETVSRFRREPDFLVRTYGVLAPLDTVRLEIVYSDHKEWYGSPGDRNLREKNPVAFIGGGMIGNGAFGLMLDKILVDASFTSGGEETLAGRTAVRYDFRLPRVAKPLQISVPGGFGAVGEEGSIWADPQSLDLIRLESRAGEIPRYIPVEEASTDVNYARMRIGAYNALLAQQADSHMLDTTRVESLNHIEFTHCHAYATRSDVRFDVDPQEPPQSQPPASPPISSSPDAAGHAVPAFLPIALQLTTPVSAGTPWAR